MLKNRYPPPPPLNKSRNCQYFLTVRSVQISRQPVNAAVRKKVSFGALILCVLCVAPLTVYAQSQRSYIGRFSFSLAPKILKDGTITDFALGYDYTEKYFGEIRLRFSNTAKNEQFDETVPDSLNAIDESSFEIFLTPLNYYFLKEYYTEFRIGAGLYYDYATLKEKGYFNMPSLELLGKEKVNSFTNDFSMHVLGPNFELGFAYRKNILNLSAHTGITPIFYLRTGQDMGIVPLMEPNHANFNHDSWGTPYFYADINFILYKYISLALLYDLSRLNYTAVDFDDKLKWYNPDKEVISQSIKFEAALLIPLQGSIYIQIGYGHTFDSIQLDSDSPVKSGRDYLILSTKTIK
jgi:hypothetical protein